MIIDDDFGRCNRSETKCWFCKHAVPSWDGKCGCSWSLKGKPVIGWVAIRRDLYDSAHYTYKRCESYLVLSCPKFEEDEPIDNQFTRWRKALLQLQMENQKLTEMQRKYTKCYKGGNYIQYYRIKAELSQNEAADRIGIDKGILSRLEHGDISETSEIYNDYLFQKMGRVYGCDPKLLTYNYPTRKEVKDLFVQ